MSDAQLDALAESARNRGLKLVRSRIRTPGKGDYGKVGLTDPSGKPVFGLEEKRLTATPAEVEAHLRNLGASDWGASLDVPVAPRKSRPKIPTRPVPRVDEPAPPPKPHIRPATAKDAAALVPLIALLGHEVEQRNLAKRISTVRKAGDRAFVATLGKSLVGLCGAQLMTMIHREQRVGRITVLVVAEKARKQSIGRMLVEAAEEHLRKAGCGLVEVTSRDEHSQAHAFYRHMGYERTSIRFAKEL